MTDDCSSWKRGDVNTVHAICGDESESVSECSGRLAASSTAYANPQQLDARSALCTGTTGVDETP